MEEKTFSIWEIVFQQNDISTLFCALIFALGILAIYLFFEKCYFYKRLLENTPDLLNNLEDFIQEGKIEAAQDYCQDVDSRESRIIEKGLERIGKPVSEIAWALENQNKIESLVIAKGSDTLKFFLNLILSLGFFGFSLQLVASFFRSYQEVLPPRYFVQSIYIAGTCLVIAFFFTIILVLFQKIQKKNLRQIKTKTQINITQFLNILNRPTS